MRIQKKGMWIGEKEISAQSGKTFTIYDPADGSPIAHVAEGGREEVELAVRAAAKAFEIWSKMGPRAKAKKLFDFSLLTRKHQEELAQMETANVGKPIQDSRQEAEAVADCLEYYAGAVQKFFGETIPVADQGLDITLREPMGVCGLIVPWNYPMMIASWKFAPALAAGNTVILNPASLTPLTALRLAEISLEAGLPEGVFNVVTGPGPTVGRAMAEHPGIPKISFTGETKTGAEIMAWGSPHIKRVSLELGGKSPNIIFDDADLELCVEKSVSSVFSNAGQDCCARSLAFIQKGIYERFLKAMLERTRRLRVNDPKKPETEMGPLISSDQREKAERYIRWAVEEGAVVACGGKTPEDPCLKKGFYLLPTILEKVRLHMRAAREEIFGPVLCVLPFKDEEEAVRLANRAEYGHSGSI